jgi:site-specific recombinase XerD
MWALLFLYGTQEILIWKDLEKSGSIYPLCFTYVLPVLPSAIIATNTNTGTMAFTIKLILQDHKTDLQGTSPIALRITSGRKSTYKVTGFRCKPDHWDPATEKVKRAVPNHHLINTTISRIKVEAEKELLEQTISGKQITKSLVKATLADGSASDFHAFARRYLESMAGIYDPQTVLVYEAALDKLKRFSPSLSFADITPEFLMRYDSWERSVLGNDQNTVWKTFVRMKRIFNVAIDQGITTVYPFKSYSVKYKKNLRGHITWEEKDKILELVKDPGTHPGIRRVALYFLLGFHTGLRQSDWQRWRKEREQFIKGDRIILEAHKAGIISIKINSELSWIIDQIGDQECYCEQTCNKRLKIIQKACKIQTILTTHIARHSFAVNGAKLGITKDKMQILLGHDSIETTGIYYKISDAILDAEMEKWEARVQLN